MLEQLTIKNVAVIDRVSVEFGNGLTVLTGETGAGKSIIIDSINMILGDRARKELVRNGAERSEVEAVFSMNDAVREVLERNDIDSDDDSIILSRKITAEGKSSARINGAAVTLNTMREIADMLINIHGQHDNQALLNPSKHIGFLDSFAKDSELLSEYSRLYKERTRLLKILDELENDVESRLQKADLLSYQVNEIESARLEPEEEEELLSRRRILERAGEINSSAECIYSCLYDNDGGESAYDLISRAVDALGGISDVSETLKEAYDSVSSAMYAIEDAAREVRDFSEGVEFDEEDFSEVSERLDLINKLKRKYGGTLEAVIEHGKRARAELSEIETSDERAEEIKLALKKNEKEIEEAARLLSDKRKSAAKKLQSGIESALHELNMEKAVFLVDVKPKAYGSDGADNVEFLISTNPGVELKPLVKIASGGELSRVMLAIKSILAKSDAVDSMIFDEIDTGVSGDAAQKIADKLKVIAESSQVICITHLPQLASAADTHFLIEKNVEGEQAETKLTKLDKQGRIAEIARIVGGGTAGVEYAEKLMKNRG